MSVPELLSCRAVTLEFETVAGAVSALTGVDFSVAEGEVVCVYGASGSGKTSLLSVLSGLERPTAGDVFIGDQAFSSISTEQLTELRLKSVGMVFQENNLVTQFTASENIELVLRCQGEPSPRDEAARLLGLVGIGELRDRRPVEMSGGQRQRVGIARALAGGRQFLLCDEPTGALDRENSITLFQLLRDLAETSGTGVVIATHDEIARDYASRCLRMVDGRIES